MKRWDGPEGIWAATLLLLPFYFLVVCLIVGMVIKTIQGHATKTSHIPSSEFSKTIR